MPLADHMIVTVNGKEVDLPEGSTLGEAIEGEPYIGGCKVAVVCSADTIKKETREFELVLENGSMVLSLNDSEYGERMLSMVDRLEGLSIRWQTSLILAIGSFPTDLEVDREYHQYGRYDCFFALGGFDNSTTYLMVAKSPHQGKYGVRGGIVGRITRGRYLMDELREGERIQEVRPVVLHTSEKDAFVTDDMDMEVEEGMAIETHALVSLRHDSPVSSEHFLVQSGDGTLPITRETTTFSSSERNMDVNLVDERSEVREEGAVTVRHDGPSAGAIYIYKERRQRSSSHNIAGEVVQGRELVRRAPKGSWVTVSTDPIRVMTIGMTQGESESFLGSLGLEQVRDGEKDDDAVVVEQEPELTMEALNADSVRTYGVPHHRVHEWRFNEGESPRTAHYLRKITGLDHKPIGSLGVYFTFSGMPMVTFNGNTKEALDLRPEKSFGEESKRGQIAVTNQSRPQKGLIGVRLEASDEFGPTGEERQGTNIAGKVVSPLKNMMEGLKDGDTVYIREVKDE